MQTPKEVMESVYRHQKPKYITCPFLVNQGVIMPGDRYFGRETEGFDAFGVRWISLGPDPGLDGNTPTPGYQVITDIANWRAQLTFPDPEQLLSPALAGKMLAGIDRENHVIHCTLLSGTFERMNQLMGFEDGLCALLEEPEAVKDPLQAISDYKIKCIDLIAERIDPDVIQMHDDWGSNNSMFMSAEMWREFIKPHEERYARHIHSKGKKYEHHSCGYITPIVGDLVELGLDALNPLNACNDMAWICREFGGRLALLGGLDNQMIDSQDTTEEQVREEVRRAMDAYGPCGTYLPHYIATRADRRDIVREETIAYGREFFSSRP